MDSLFGLSMDLLMAGLLSIFLSAMTVVAVVAWRNRVMVKLGLRNIPRRPGQTVLIVVGVMLSTVIVSAAFGTGDTLSHSIRHEVVSSLGEIDVVIVSVRGDAGDSFGSSPYISPQRLQQLLTDLSEVDGIDGLLPLIDERVPSVNPRTSLGEGALRVVGIDPERMAGFRPLQDVAGKQVSLEQLAEGEAYLNDRAATELEASPGDLITVFLKEQAHSITVKAVVERSGLAGRDPTMLMPMLRAQELFGRPGESNGVVVSIRGGQITSPELSRSVAREARVVFNRRDVAVQLHSVLGQASVLAALERETATLANAARETALSLQRLLERPEFTDELNSLLADREVITLVMGILEGEEFQEEERLVATLFQDLAEFHVLEVKREALEQAELAGSFVTSFFMTMGMFSIVVGMLLIFLIFVMLAAARRSEMGMARAVGAKRRHMVQMFMFEGTAYSLVSAAVGVVLGMLISALIVTALNRIFAGTGQSEGFRLTPQFAIRTMLVSYCLGMVITFATVAVSAYRVSRLNIVAAVRGLPNPPPGAATPWRGLLASPWRSLLLPFRHAFGSPRALLHLKPTRTLALLLRAAWAVVVFPWSVAGALAQLMGRFFLQGWLSLLFGIALAYVGAALWQRDSPFSAGVSLTILGLGLMVRQGLARARVRPARRDRIAFTFTGVTMLAFWMLPVGLVKELVGELRGDLDMLFVSGIFMVAAAVWTVMYNSDLLLRGVALATSPIGRLRPVLVTAVAYPMSAKFRTGLTLAMFALVIFTLIVMSILTETFGTQFGDTERFTGGWQIEARVNPSTPISDIRARVAETPSLKLEDLEAVGGYTWLPATMRDPAAQQQAWKPIQIRAADDGFLLGSRYDFKLIADGFGDSAEDVCAAMTQNPTLAVLGGNLVNTRAGSEDWRSGYVESTAYGDASMSPFEVEVREPRTGATTRFTVVGLLNRDHEDAQTMLVSRGVLDRLVPFPVPITHYRFRVMPGLDIAQTSRNLEAAFLEHGMDSVVLREQMERAASSGRAFMHLFIGFMALGLVVGIAALGVVSTRAVVERRQQIGVLRAIGYRRGMILLSFLLESSFVSLLGMAIGTVLGVILGYQAFTDISQEESVDSIHFAIPWAQVGLILVLTYIFSMLATFLPARQASRVFPAEALRYE